MAQGLLSSRILFPVRIPVLTINRRWSSCSLGGSHQPFHLPLKNFRNPPDAVPWVYFSFDEKYCVLFDWAGPVTASKDGSCKSVRATPIRFLPGVRILLGIKPLSLSKAGEFSSVLEMPSGFSAQLYSLMHLGGVSFSCSTSVSLAFLPQKKTTNNYCHCASESMLCCGNCCYKILLPVWGLLLERDLLHYPYGHTFQESGGTCETIGKRSMNVLVLLTACLKSLKLQRFLAPVAILSLSVVRF